MVNLEWFRTFIAIYETGSLTAAANLLYISQPGVSLHLNSLEAHIGYKLFDRGTRKMLATERGQILYNSIVDPVKKLTQAEKHFQRNSGCTRSSVSIGMCLERFESVLEPHISALPFDLISKFGEYPEMLADLDKGLLDLVVSPQKDDSFNLSYTAFSSEKLILVAGSKSDTAELEDLLERKDWAASEQLLSNQIWFGTAGDMEHLRNFWLHNFKKRPDFKPNFIVPNLTSIVRCISGRAGFAVIPSFLGEKDLATRNIKLVWDGVTTFENSLYFVQRNKTIYSEEIALLQQIIQMATTD